MIRKQREQLARLFALSDALAIAAAFFISFWLRFYSGLLRVPRGVPRFSSYLIVIPFLLFIHMVYFSYQGFYRFKLRRNRLDDLFSVILNCMAAAFTVLLVFSYLKSYRFTAFEISHVFLAVYAPVAVVAIVPALLLYEVSKEAGAFHAIRRGIESYTPNELLHVLAIGWVFSSFLQGITGFGAPAAVTAPLLVALACGPSGQWSLP